ncbi:hypothetical protein BKA64DRAFT_660549 [Cadophora sp. MPI-SDFR-AT-0126]|nr:hypothetical protein BKA64DRAFT_660549 [Leotiomycetes sp. MPI-SDFR-AT-0126]
MAPPTLLASSQIKRKLTRKSRRGTLIDRPLPALPSIPENSSLILREERGWNVGLGKPLPSLPSSVETVTSPLWETATSPVLQAEKNPDAPGVASTAYITRHPPPNVVWIPQPKKGALPAEKTNLPQDSSSGPHRSIQTPEPPFRPPPPPPVTSASHNTARAAPRAGPTARRLKSRDTSNRLRDAFNGTEASHIPAVPPPPIERKPLPESAFPAYLTIPSQLGGWKREAGEVWQRTKANWNGRKSPLQDEELFLKSMEEGSLDQGELPSSLTSPATLRRDSLTRLSTMFNQFSVTSDEQSIRGDSLATKTYTAYSGGPARLSTEENPLMSYAAHQARRTMAVEFDGRNHPAAPAYTTKTTYSPMPETGHTSQLPAPHYVPEEFMYPLPSQNRSSIPENSLSELPTNYNMTPKSHRKASVEFVSANSNRNQSTTLTNKGKSISELSEHFNMAEEPYDGTPIELEAHSRPRVPLPPTKDYKMSARLSTVGLYDHWDLLEPTPSVTAELPGTSMSSTPMRELPDIRRFSVMSFDGTVLETVCQKPPEE